MIIGLFVCIIGLIPIMLSLSVRKILKRGELFKVLSIFMILVGIWQLSIAVLYLKDILSEQLTLFLFRFLRLGTTFSIPVMFMFVYVVLRDNVVILKKNKVSKFIQLLMSIYNNKKVGILLIITSIIVYVINWTELGIKGLQEKKIYQMEIYYYFPEYGSLSWIFLIHMSTILIMIISIYIISKHIQNSNMKRLLSKYSVYTAFFYLPGFINFLPGTGAIFGSLGVVVSSILIMFSFVSFNLNNMIKFNQLMERQKKLDFTGAYTGSLVHEVNNLMQIITVSSQLLNESTSLKTNDKEKVQLIQKATKQVVEISNNYYDYMKLSKLELQLMDLNAIIEESIDLAKEYVKGQKIEIEFNKSFSNLKSYVNKVYIQQVIINLIKNSSESMLSDRDNKKISIYTNIVEDSTFIHFQDNGKGIPESIKEHIFDPFISSKETSMGLGLAFVKKIMFEHRGDIRLMESDHKGTHFRMELPNYL